MGNTLRAQEMQHQQYRFVLCVIGLVAVVTASGGHKGKAKGKMPHATACKGSSCVERLLGRRKERGTVMERRRESPVRISIMASLHKHRAIHSCHSGAMGTSKDTRMAGMVTGESTKASLGCQLSSSVSGSWPWWQPVWQQQRCSVVIPRSRKSISRQLLLCAALLQQDRSSMYRRKTQ